MMWFRFPKKNKLDFSTQVTAFTFNPHFNLITELDRLEAEMKRFFPYLGHNNCRELNKAVRIVRKIKKRVEIK